MHFKYHGFPSKTLLGTIVLEGISLSLFDTRNGCDRTHTVLSRCLI